MNKDSKIIITGATGFLGASLVLTLVRMGYSNIHALVRPKADCFFLEPILDQIVCVEGDINEVEPLFTVVEDADYFFHCAGLISYRDRDYQDLYATNAEGTANVVNACLTNPEIKLIYVSSTSALAAKNKKYTVHERYFPSLQELSSNYGKTKLLGEFEVWRGIEEGLSAAIVNPSMIIGGGFWSKGTANFVTKIDHGLKYFPKGANGFVDVRDVVDFMIALMSSNLTEQRYLLSGHQISFHTFFEKIANQLGSAAPNRPVTPLIGEIAWRASELFARISGKPALITKETVRNSSKTVVFDNEKSLSEDALPFQYRPIDTTISDWIAVYQATKTTKGGLLIL